MDFSPCHSIVHTCSVLSISPKMTFLIAWVIVVFFFFFLSWWGLELVDTTDLARDLGWSLSLPRERTS